jgi:hypothetical protein
LDYVEKWEMQEPLVVVGKEKHCSRDPDSFFH